ncbi:MAG: tetratricopeptide repeat protein [Verrucomicrobia bacterium]|nr:tetratricopeptide repeat protein [Verrucomicrobiota bacterium]
MGLPKVSLLLITLILLSGFNLVSAQNASNSLKSGSGNDAVDGFSELEDKSDAEQLVDLKDRLRQIESMLLAQKDRENELLRDLNKFVLTVQDQPAEPSDALKELEATEKWFQAESAALAAKIKSLEVAVEASYERDMRMGQEMNKTIIITVSAVAGVGLLVFLVTVYLQYRLMSRPVQPVYVQAPVLALEAAPPQLPAADKEPAETPETRLVENTKVDDTNERFVSAIERLEQRIMHMEEGLAHPDVASNPDFDSHSAEEREAEPAEVVEEVEVERIEHAVAAKEVSVPEKPSKAPPVTDEPVEVAASEVEELLDEDETESDVVTDDMDVALLEEEGKRFLQKEDWETAFQYFNQLVRLDGQRVDNWVNRGRALEMLKREEEALGSYDKAIEINPELPSPFLYKAALLSRLERFEEAQKFYNEALSKVPVQKNQQPSTV